jgi:hypothetical protein
MAEGQTKAKEKRFWAEVCKWRDRLQLGEWAIGWKPAGEGELVDGVGANITPDCTYRRAEIRIAEWRAEDGMAFHARHEVLHLVFADLRQLAEGMAEDCGNSDLAATYRRQYGDLEERAVTRLCRAFDTLEHIGGGEEDYV